MTRFPAHLAHVPPFFFSVCCLYCPLIFHAYTVLPYVTRYPKPCAPYRPDVRPQGLEVTNPPNPGIHKERREHPAHPVQASGPPRRCFLLNENAAPNPIASSHP